MKISIIFLLLLLFIIVIILYKQIKGKKNIGQKISFLYNQLYNILIIGYYGKNNKLSLKDEVIDYYKDIVRNKKIFEKNKNGQELKGFLLKYYEFEQENINYIYEAINLYYNKYYKSLQKTIMILSYVLVVIIMLFLFLITKI